jgi:hypothetical protein
MPPKDYEQELLDYLAQQFPATIGHYPLREKIHAVWQQGMQEAARLCVKEFVGTNDGFVAKHACEKAILAAAWPND